MDIKKSKKHIEGEVNSLCKKY